MAVAIFSWLSLPRLNRTSALYFVLNFIYIYIMHLILSPISTYHRELYFQDICICICIWVSQIYLCGNMYKQYKIYGYHQPVQLSMPSSVQVDI